MISFQYRKEEMPEIDHIKNSSRMENVKTNYFWEIWEEILFLWKHELKIRSTITK